MSRRPDRGMVTAETAVLAPAVAACLAVGVWIVSLGHTQVRLVDSARDVARLVARGQSPASAVADVKPSAPAHARFDVRRSDDFVTVVVSQRAASPLPGLSWPLRARASCVDES